MNYLADYHKNTAVQYLIADDGICFDGNSPLEGPLGGVESSVVNLCNALAARGHEVLVSNRCLEAVVVDGVDWAPIDFGLPITADMYIANRGDKLIPLMPQAGRKVFWIHNPAHYLLKWRYFWKLWKHKPTIIFIYKCLRSCMLYCLHKITYFFSS